MKCDKLRIENACVYGPDAKVYLAEQVDAAIAELKQKLEDVQASAYAEMVDANMENRRLKRALWLARYWRARCEMDYWGKLYEHYEEYYHVETNENLSKIKCECMIEKWIRAQDKFIKKAEEYK